EDGIRAFHVTGVQTCALPISAKDALAPGKAHHGTAAPQRQESPLLKVEQLEVAYGEVQVIWGVDMEVYDRQVEALVGSNGAGKSTILKTIAGALKPKAGRLIFAGQDVTG